MADRSSKSDPKGVGTKAGTVTQIGILEENVLRMRYGFAAPDDLELESVGQSTPEIAARVREIELEAYRKAGRLDELRREVGLEDRPRSDVKTRDKIIERLRNLESDE